MLAPKTPVKQEKELPDNQTDDLMNDLFQEISDDLAEVVQGGCCCCCCHHR